MRSQLALITFLDGDSGHVPSHPIVVPPGQPVYPDNTLPPVPPGYWGGVAPPFPSHPIAPGGPPPQPTHPWVPPSGIWPTPPRPDNTLPPGGSGVGSTPGYPVQLPAFDPSDGGWVWSWVPGYGWMWSWVPNPNPPRPDNTLPGPQPEVNPLT